MPPGSHFIMSRPTIKSAGPGALALRSTGAQTTSAYFARIGSGADPGSQLSNRSANVARFQTPAPADAVASRLRSRGMLGACFGFGGDLSIAFRVMIRSVCLYPLLPSFIP